MWTLDEFAEQVRLVLTRDPVDQPSQRVTELPTGRVIRYYTTHGLLDKPVFLKGRTAHYGWRHLLQVIAIKRLQAAGLSLTEIQARLVGLPDTDLAAIARLPVSEGPPAPPAPVALPAPARRSQQPFWSRESAPAVQPAAPPPPSPPASRPVPVREWQTLPLADGVWLGLAGAKDWSSADWEAVREAAGPLLTVLSTRGLVAAATEGRTP